MMGTFPWSFLKNDEGKTIAVPTLPHQLTKTSLILGTIPRHSNAPPTVMFFNGGLLLCPWPDTEPHVTHDVHFYGHQLSYLSSNSTGIIVESSF